MAVYGEVRRRQRVLQRIQLKLQADGARRRLNVSRLMAESKKLAEKKGELATRGELLARTKGEIAALPGTSGVLSLSREQGFYLGCVLMEEVVRDGTRRVEETLDDLKRASQRILEQEELCRVSAERCSGEQRMLSQGVKTAREELELENDLLPRKWLLGRVLCLMLGLFLLFSPESTLAKEQLETPASARSLLTEFQASGVLDFKPGAQTNPIAIGGFFFAMALLPLVLMGLTSYLKISVVLSILRNALGLGQVPSQALSAILSLCLSAFVMAPVAKDMAGVWTGFSGPDWLKRIELVSEPLQRFLVRHARTEERVFFSELWVLQHEQYQRRQEGESTLASKELTLRQVTKRVRSEVERCKGESCAPKEESLLTLAPAFMFSELRAAFHIGFILFLPFLVIDLVVTNVLVGMGMTMINPIVVTLPLKILLFTLCNGWLLLAESLVLSYGV